MYNNIALLIGHFVGDYIFQNDWMAKNKIKPGLKGADACFTHTFIYSVCVTFFVLLGGWRYKDLLQSVFIVFGIAFLSHYWIDRYSVGNLWMDIYKHSKFDGKNPFVPIVYVAIDNTMHMVLMWVALSLMQ